jgi:hypothetical protein
MSERGERKGGRGRGGVGRTWRGKESISFIKILLPVGWFCFEIVPLGQTQTPPHALAFGE